MKRQQLQTNHTTGPILEKKIAKNFQDEINNKKFVTKISCKISLGK